MQTSSPLTSALSSKIPLGPSGAFSCAGNGGRDVRGAGAGASVAESEEGRVVAKRTNESRSKTTVGTATMRGFDKRTLAEVLDDAASILTVAKMNGLVESDFKPLEELPSEGEVPEDSLSQSDDVEREPEEEIPEEDRETE